MALIEEIPAGVDAGYEVDAFPVGDGGRSGDAMVVRFGDLYGPTGRPGVVVVDGGFLDDGQAIVAHLAEYGIEYVDVVVSTHPDSDHANGLMPVLEQLAVGELWVHLPWDHTDADLFADGRLTDDSVGRHLRENLESVRELATLADRKGVKIVEPFTGLTTFGGAITVVGPDLSYYEDLVPDFRSAPAGKVGKLAGLREFVVQKAEDFNIETLTDSGTTSAENNSSVVLLLELADQRILLTGDSGMPALSRAADQLESMGKLESIDVFQIPHHGSQHNVGPSLLDRLVGPKTRSRERDLRAFVSAAAGGAPRHPSKRVTNAFSRRGARVVGTIGRRLCVRKNAPDRPNWVPATEIPFYDEVEEEDEI